MLDFKLDAAEGAAQEEFRQFASAIIRPYAVDADKIADIPQELLRRNEILNFMRIYLPKEYGGGWPGLDHLVVEEIGRSARLRVVISEELGWGDAALYAAIPGHGPAEQIVMAVGRPEQKRRLLAPLSSKLPVWGAFAMSEPNAGSDVAAIATTARKEKDRYIINGVKYFIGNGARADWVIVFATINPRLGQFGIRPFIVKKGTPGFLAARILPTMGMRALQISELVFEECTVAEEEILGFNKQDIAKSGFQFGLRALYSMRPVVTALAVGIARRAIGDLEDLVRNERSPHFRRFRRGRIINKIDEMKNKLHVVRLLNWKAAWIHDQGGDNARETSMAKALAGKICMEICSEAMLLAGTKSLSALSSFEKLFRDIKVFDILEGTGEIHRLMVAASLLRNNLDRP
jgi:acyl-CoA dehydrogenase